jgi:lysozyme family protein
MKQPIGTEQLSDGLRAILGDTELPNEIKLALLNQQFDREKFLATQALERKRWLYSTPVAVALAGGITILLNWYFGSLETDQQSIISEQSAAREFQYGILRSELEKDLTNEEKANVLLFLVKAGILNDLNQEYLVSLAEENLGDVQQTIPSLGRGVGLPSSIASNREIVDLIRVLEGGFIDPPNVPGGATNAGITQRTLASFRGVESVTPDDVRNLTDDEIFAMYDKFYIQRSNADGIDSLRLRAAFLSFAVNAGTSRATRTLEAAAELPRDGDLDASDLAAINARMDARGDAFIVEFNCRILAFYRGLRSWDVFGRAWTRRLQAFTPEGDLDACADSAGKEEIQSE